MDEFGLPRKALEKLRAVFDQHPDVADVRIYGSRAIGRQRPGSDIDLALFGEDLKPQTLKIIERELDDLMLPYSIDVAIYESLKNAALKEHINRIGQDFLGRVSTGICARD